MDLSAFFECNRKCALAFSGGTDSAYLLSAAVKAGIDIKAYFCKSQFQPDFEFRDALRLLDELKVSYKIVNVDILENKEITENTSSRCAFCKQIMFARIISEAAADGYQLVIDGTNASDREELRPGMRVLKEFGVRSPLRESGLTKERIRVLSKEAGLFTWNKPSYSCLATRVQTGTTLTSPLLWRVEQGECKLMQLGFSDFRLRTDGVYARIEATKDQFEDFFLKRELIHDSLCKLYDVVCLDLKYREK